MSSTGRVQERQALDDYPTQKWCVHRFVEAYELPAGLWCEPCAGAGSIIQAVAEKRNDVGWHANELNGLYLPKLQALPSVTKVTIGDARTLTVGRDVRVIKTNPTFALSLEILLTMLQATWALTVFLQRLNWAAGPRRDLFRAMKPSVYVLPDRPSFIDTYEERAPEVLKPGTDSIEYAWFVFDGFGDFRVLGDTPDSVRRAEIEEGRRLGTRPKRLAKPKRKKEAA